MRTTLPIDDHILASAQALAQLARRAFPVFPIPPPTMPPPCPPPQFGSDPVAAALSPQNMEVAGNFLAPVK